MLDLLLQNIYNLWRQAGLRPLQTIICGLAFFILFQHASKQL